MYSSSMNWSFAKQLLTLGMQYMAIPDLKLTLHEGLFPNLPDPITSLVASFWTESIHPN